MAKIETYFDCDLKKAVQVQPLNGNVFSLDNNGNRIGVRIFDNGVKTTVTGTVTGRAILADNSTVNLNGGLTTVNGQSVAYVDVLQGALLIPGTIKITIQLTASGVITTLAAILSTVYQTKTDNVITPSAQVIADWNAEISAAIATQNAAIANQDTKINDLKSAISENAVFDNLFHKDTNRVTEFALTWNDGSYTDGGVYKADPNAKRVPQSIKNGSRTVFELLDYSYRIKLLICTSNGGSVTSVTNKNESVIVPRGTCFKIAVEGSNPITNINEIVNCYVLDEEKTDDTEFQSYIGYTKIVFKDSTSINCNVNIGDTVTINQGNAWGYRSCIIDVYPGDMLILDVQGGGNPRTYAMLDKDNKLIAKSNDSEAVNKAFVIPTNVSKIILNDQKLTTNSYKFTNIARGVGTSELIEIVGIGTQSAGTSEVTKEGQYYFNYADYTVHLVTSFSSATDFVHIPVMTGIDKLFLYKGMIGKFNYSTAEFIPIPGQQINIQGIGTKGAGTSGVKAAGQFFIHQSERKLKLCKSFTSTTNFTDTNVPFYKNILYVMNGKIYEYVGNDGNVSNGSSYGLMEKENPSFGGKAGKNIIENFGEDDVCSFIRGIKFADELKQPIADMKKDGDLMVHVSTFKIINNIIYCTYYANTHHATETPTEHTARFVYCALNNTTNKTYIDLQDIGDTFDGKTVQAIYDTILLSKDDNVLFLMWTAKLNGSYCRLYKTYTISTGELSATAYNYFYADETGGVWNTENMISAIESKLVWHKPFSSDDDIGLMQKITARTENGTTYYYSGAYAGQFNCIVKSSDLVNWYFVAAPDFYTDSRWENAVYVIGDKVYYFIRQFDKETTGILVSYHLTSKEWSEPVYVFDCQSRSDFFECYGKLWLVHAEKDRNHISIMQVDKNNLARSIEFQTAKVPDYFYPFVQFYNDELYMSFTNARAHIYISKFTIGESNDSIIEKFKALLS